MKKLLVIVAALAAFAVHAENKRDGERKFQAREPSTDSCSLRHNRSLEPPLGEISVFQNESGTEFNCYIPNTFTPNNDGLNDVFTLFGTELQSVSMEIYSRGGQKLFESQSIVKGWDGTFNGTPCEVATYVYIMKITSANGEVVRKIGHVNLIR